METTTQPGRSCISIPKPQPKKAFISQIPDSITKNSLLNQAIDVLPKNYRFEIHKQIWRISQLKLELNQDKIKVGLQFPEGLLMYACLISDILQQFAQCECIIMGDVTYGACCINDLGAKALQCNFIIHFGHSCLVPVTETCLKALYVFVEIMIDVEHFVETFKLNLQDRQQAYHLMATIQFNTVLFQIQKMLQDAGYQFIIIPQEKPRSAGEILGCTSPVINNGTGNGNCNEGVLIFISDGRFHIESAMIANPNFIFYQYSPYSKKMTIEKYDNKQMLKQRLNAVNRVKEIFIQQHNRQNNNYPSQSLGIIVGTLGRQGNIHILGRLKQILNEKHISYGVFLFSELDPIIIQELNKANFACFIQIACPRLSVDWGAQFCCPVLTPYEAYVALDQCEWSQQYYPMDYYSNNGGEWSNNFHRKALSNDTDRPIQQNNIISQ